MHAVIAFAALPLFLGALLGDGAYALSHQVQWANFASWLIAGALPLVGLALVCGAAVILRAPSARNGPGIAYLLLLLATLVLGIVNALVHARDGWAVMPAGPVLSAIVLLLDLVACVVGLSNYFRRTP